MNPDQLLRLRDIIHSAARRGATRWVQKTVNALKRVAPVASSETRSSIRGHVESLPPRLVVSLEAPTKQASYTERGTKAHGINPRFKRALHWRGRKGTVTIGRHRKTGRWMVSRAGRGGVRRWLMPVARQFAVWHPGTEARPWFWPTVRAEQGWLAIEIKAAMADALRSMARPGRRG